MTAAELAALVGGRLAGADRSFAGVGPLESAQEHECAYADKAVPDGCRAGVLLVRQALDGRCCVVVDQPKQAFMVLLGQLFPEADGVLKAPRGTAAGKGELSTWTEAKVHSGASVHGSVLLGVGVVVHAGAWVGAHCVLGAGSIVYPNAVLYPGVELGQDCRIHAGAVLGADGFSYEPGPTGPVKVPQVGRVVLGDRVEVGPNTVVDRAFLETTTVGDDAKLDALVMVGHNCRIGRGAILVGQAGLAGSVDVGDFAQIAGQAGIADHRSIGAGARVGARAGVHRDVPAGETVLGAPALPVRQAMRLMASMPYLPDLLRWWRKERQEPDSGG